MIWMELAILTKTICMLSGSGSFLEYLCEYHDLYIEPDIHLIAGVFENFRSLCLKMFGIDAAHFYMAPRLAWQAALKMTSEELELFTDPDMQKRWNCHDF